MHLEQQLLHFIMSPDGHERFTQDTPILPDVWLELSNLNEDRVDARLDVILTPWKGTSPHNFMHVFSDIDKNLAPDLKNNDDIAVYQEYHYHVRRAQNQREIALKVTLKELIIHYLPLTKWWQYNRHKLKLACDGADIEDGLHFLKILGIVVMMGTDEGRAEVEMYFQKTSDNSEHGLLQHSEYPGNFLERAIVITKEGMERDNRYQTILSKINTSPFLWNVNLNRSSILSQNKSRKTIKADAANRVFELDANEITWAVVDSGIDALHPAFSTLSSPIFGEISNNKVSLLDHSRITATYDFTKLRDVVSGVAVPNDDIKQRLVSAGYRAIDLKDIVHFGRSFNWDIVEPLIRVSHDEHYYRPKFDHGTHVAGILGGGDVYNNEYSGDDDPWMSGVAPTVNMIDIRVFDDKGKGDEFTINAALQFIAYLNRDRGIMNIHGVNLSLSVNHSVKNYACGQTPVCQESKRLVDSGVVVVAAAGNNGFQQYKIRQGYVEGYLSSSITDPGNTEEVITVGATHRERPHTYGVSYFSSRGPTGDGRMKPDILAPGERITAPVLDGNFGVKDGTSMAAPHVSGAAVLLMARHNELRGKPARIKQILMSSATDLGREKYFQGAGLLDILRAMEAV